MAIENQYVKLFDIGMFFHIAGVIITLFVDPWSDVIYSA